MDVGLFLFLSFYFTGPIQSAASPGGCVVNIRFSPGKYSCGSEFRSYIARSPHQVREEGGRGLSGFFVARILRSGGSYFNDDANN